MGWFFTSSHPYCVSGSAYNRADHTKHSGRLLIDGDHLLFEGADAQVQLPLAGLRATRNRLWGGPIRMWHRDEPHWELRTHHTTLFKDPAFQQDEDLIDTYKRLRLNWYRIRRLARMLLLLFFVSFIAFPLFRTNVTGAALYFVPVSREIALGNRTFQRIEREQRMLDDPQLNATLAVITQRVTDALPRKLHKYPFQFHIANDSTVNAYAIPGGHIVLHSQLILEARSSDELAGVLAHEVGHVVHRHSFRKMAEIVGSLVVAKVMLGDLDAMPDVALIWMLQSYSRDAESEADSTALMLLEDARVDPQGLIGFFDRQAAAYRRTVGGEMDMWIRMNSTHPLPDERARTLRACVAKFDKGFKPEFIDIDFPGFQRRVRELTATPGPSPSTSAR